MRNLVLTIAAGAAAIGMTAPASAQFYPVPTYRYQPYNYGYHFNRGFGFAREMQSRVERIRGDIRNMQARRILSYNEARRLDREAASVQRRIYLASRNGISPGEARNVENRINRLQRDIIREANDWNGRYGHRRH